MYMVNLLTSISDLVGWNFKDQWSYYLNFIKRIAFWVPHIYREGNRVVDALSKDALGISQQQG